MNVLMKKIRMSQGLILLGCVLAALQVEAVDGDDPVSIFQSLPPDVEFEKVTKENTNLTAKAKKALKNLKDNPGSLPYLNGAKTILKALESSRKKLTDLRTKYRESNHKISFLMLNNNQEMDQADKARLVLVRDLNSTKIRTLGELETDNSILLEKMHETNVVGNVWVNDTLYYVEFNDNVTAENLNESDVTPYIESIVDSKGNKLDPASDLVNDIVNYTSQDTGAASGRVCLDSANSPINCEAAGAPD